MSAPRPHAQFFMGHLSERSVRSIIETVEDLGYSTRITENDSQYTYTVDDESPIFERDKRVTRSRHEVAEQIFRNEHATFEFRFSDAYRYKIYFSPTSGDLERPVWIRGPVDRAFDPERNSAEEVRRHTRMLVALFVRLSELLDPWFAFMHVSKDPPAGVVPNDYPPEHGIEHLGWLSVFSPEWVDYFGGTDRVLQAPAYNVRQLETGSVLIQEWDTPSHRYQDRDHGSPLSTYEYLFDKRSLDEMRAERKRKQETIVDPVADLEPGQTATDIVMCNGHAPFAGPETSYREIVATVRTTDHCAVLRVYRDEHDRLWEVDSEMFVRRLVNEHGERIGSLPDGVPPERELISLSVDSELNVWPLDAFELHVTDKEKLQESENRNMITSFYGLLGLSAGRDIWVEEDLCYGAFRDEPETDTSEWIDL